MLLPWLWSHRQYLHQAYVPLLCCLIAAELKLLKLHLTQEGAQLYALLRHGNRLLHLPDPRLYVAWLGSLLQAVEEQQASLDLGLWLHTARRWREAPRVEAKAMVQDLERINTWDPNHCTPAQLGLPYLHGVLDTRFGMSFVLNKSSLTCKS